MIEFEFDQRTVQQVEKKLGDMKNKTPKVIKDALNRTAKQNRSAPQSPGNIHGKSWKVQQRNDHSERDNWKSDSNY